MRWIEKCWRWGVERKVHVRPTRPSVPLPLAAGKSSKRKTEMGWRMSIYGWMRANLPVMEWSVGPRWSVADREVEPQMAQMNAGR